MQIVIVDGAPPSSVFTDTGTTNSTATTYTFNNRSFGTESADRYVLVCAAFSDATGTRDTSSLTIDGVTATLLVSDTATGGGGGVGTSIYVAPLPTGTTGDVVHKLTGNGTSASIAVFAVTGWAGASSVTTSNTNDPTTLNLSRPAYSTVVGVGTAVNDFTTDPGVQATWTNLTEASDVAYNTGNSIGTSSANDDFTAADAAFAVTCNMRLTGSRHVGCMVALYN